MLTVLNLYRIWSRIPCEGADPVQCLAMEARY